MRQGNGQGVGGVRGGRGGQLQKALNHFGDGEFLRGAVADMACLILRGEIS